jgi:hypothetical protein
MQIMAGISAAETKHGERTHDIPYINIGELRATALINRGKLRWRMDVSV